MQCAKQNAAENIRAGQATSWPCPVSRYKRKNINKAIKAAEEAMKLRDQKLKQLRPGDAKFWNHAYVAQLQRTRSLMEAGGVENAELYRRGLDTALKLLGAE